MLHSFLNLLFPRTCTGCHQPLQLNEALICTDCRFELPKTDSHIYPDEKIMNRFAGKVFLKHVFSYLKFVKGGRTQQLMHALKYKGKQEVGVLLGQWYGAELKQLGYDKEFDLLIPIPLHKSRLQNRGYNQAACFAQGLAVGLEITMNEGVLVRNHQTDTQIHKSRYERFENMQGVFELKDISVVRDKHLVLVDDTLTTGATIEACALVLLEAKPASISVITAAVAY